MKPYKPPTPEASLTRSVRALLNAAGIWHFKHWGGPMGEKGVSDIIGCYQGRMIALELKAPNGKVSYYQQRFLDSVKAAGGIALVVRSIEDVIVGLGLEHRFLIR